MKNLLIGIFILASSAISSTGWGQVRLSIAAGYGSYAMAEVRDHQTVYKSMPNAQTVSSFPANWYYALTGEYYFTSRFCIGISATYGSTSGKIDYGSYPGRLTDQLTIEHRIEYIAIGLPVGIKRLIANEKMGLQFGLQPTVFFGNLDWEWVNKFGVLVHYPYFTEEFKCLNIGLQPLIRLDKTVAQFQVFIQGGYNIDVYKSKLENKGIDIQVHSSADAQGHLTNPLTEDAVHADFSGLRIEAGVAFVIGK